MPRCTDERTAYLRSLGYNVISLPRAGIRPLTVAFLSNNGRLTELGYLPEVWTSAVGEPQAATGTVAQLGGQRTSKLNAEVGLDVLGNLIGALGGDPIGIKAEFGNAKTFEFSFMHVERDRVTPLALGRYVTEGSLNSENPFVKRYFAPGEKLYVVCEVLKSSSFGVTATASTSTDLGLKVPLVQQAISGNGSIKVESTSKNSFAFEGVEKLPFAFIAARMQWRNDRWEVGDFPQPGMIHLGEATAHHKIIIPGEARSDGAVIFGEEPVNFERAESN